jgi:hypothetical protein
MTEDLQIVLAILESSELRQSCRVVRCDVGKGRPVAALEVGKEENTVFSGAQRQRIVIDTVAISSQGAVCILSGVEEVQEA